MQQCAGRGIEGTSLIGIRDLARHLDISIGTVSRALNDKADVNPLTRQRVREAAAKLGYSPNQSGRSLRRGQTDLVGMIVPTGSTEHADQHGFSLRARWAASQCSERRSRSRDFPARAGRGDLRLAAAADRARPCRRPDHLQHAARRPAHRLSHREAQALRRLRPQPFGRRSRLGRSRFRGAPSRAPSIVWPRSGTDISPSCWRAARRTTNTSSVTPTSMR